MDRGVRLEPEPAPAVRWRPLLGPQHRQVGQALDAEPARKPTPIAVSARAGDTNARDSVIRIERSLLPSRNEPLLRRGDGARWNRSHQQRRMATALQRAGLDKEATFYALRHSYISRAIEREVPLNIIADNCGTSVRIIETTYAKVLASTGFGTRFA